MEIGGSLAAQKKKKMLENQMKNERAKEMVEDKRKELKNVYEDFQKMIQKFAEEHPKEVRKNPDVRNKFNKICVDLGVDPMVSKKTMWSNLGFGDFYNELAIKIYRICISKRSSNGGMMNVNEIINIYTKKNEERITKEDIKKALDTLRELGTGCTLKGDYVISIPVEMNNDALDLIDAGDKSGYVSSDLMQKTAGWNLERFNRAVNELISEGLVWVDSQTGGVPHYYFPSMWE